MKHLIVIASLILSLTSISFAEEAAPKSEGGTVRKDGARVWVEKVPPLGWEHERTTTFGGALESATAVTPYPVAYTDLMGMTALAFRTRFFTGPENHRWDPSSPVGEMEREITIASKVTGWQLSVDVRLGKPGEKHDMTDKIPDIVKSIDAGKPVLGYDSQFNMLVIYGYEDGGKKLLTTDYSGRRPPIIVEDKNLNAFLMFLGDHKDPKEKHQAVLEGIELAIKQWKAPPEKRDDGEYKLGKEALEKWISDLESAEKLEDGQRQGLFFINWWVYCVLANARQAGAEFLKDHSHEFSGPSADALLKAAALFEEESKAAQAAWEGSVFMGPWQQNHTFADWNNDVRAQEIKMLKDVMTKDAAAFAEMEKALAMDQE